MLTPTSKMENVPRENERLYYQHLHHQRLQTQRLRDQRLQAQRLQRKRTQRQRQQQSETDLSRMGRRTFLAMLGLVGLRWLTGNSEVSNHRSQLGGLTRVSFDPSPEFDLASSRSPAAPLQVERITINGIPLYRTVINLRDPEVFLSIGLAKNATKANNHRHTVGDEAFRDFLPRYPAALVASGTFFSMDAEKRVMGNMVSEGRFLKYSPAENYGTTLGLRAGNQLEMVTARVEDKPQWDQHWFSITCGPRLLKQGEIWIAPKSEGFRDPSVLGIGTRCALGFPQGGDQLILATFLTSLTLQQEAEAMKALGCYEAMNLDGGTSVALAHRGEVLLDAERPLTNVLVIYDVDHPAPAELKASWQRFQAGDRPVPTA